MNRKLIIFIIVMALVFGAAGSVILNRWIVPFLSTVQGFSWVSKLHTNTPIVVTRREEVRLNEGVNLIELTKQAQTWTVSIYSTGPNAQFLGNGISVSSDGLIFTVRDFLPADGLVNVVTDNGTVLPGQVRALDPKSPLAVISTSAQGLQAPQFSNAGNMQIAQRVFALGRTNQEFTRSFVSGLVSRTLSNNVNSSQAVSADSFNHTLTTDADINADYIGSPVINLQGMVVGIVTNSAGQILASEYIDGALKSYLAEGKITRPVWGFDYQVISTNDARVRGLAHSGALVTRVVPASPAAAAGLTAQDMILEINGQRVSVSSLEQLLVSQGTNETRVLVVRGGQEITLTIRPTLR